MNNPETYLLSHLRKETSHFKSDGSLGLFFNRFNSIFEHISIESCRVIDTLHTYEACMHMACMRSSTFCQSQNCRPWHHTKIYRAACDLPQHRLPSTIYWGFDKLTVIRGIVPPPRNNRVNNTTIRVDVTITSLFSFSISICRLSAKAIAPRSPTILKRRP